MKSKLLSGASIILACLFSLTVSASTPADVRDLVGEKAKNADPKLQRRGYVHIESQKTGSHNSYGMWWSPSARTCLTVGYEHGRVDTIHTAPPIDCNQHGYFDGDDDDVNAAAVAVGAAALIGVLAASHKSHHHESNTHESDQQNEEEFERGYRDGLYNNSFDDYRDTQAYVNGYRSGVDQRQHNASYRYQDDRYDHGYQREVEFTDLVGTRGSSADKELASRGFRDVDTIKSNNAAYTYWYNGHTGQCLQMMVVDGRDDDIRDVGHHPQCR